MQLQSLASDPDLLVCGVVIVAAAAGLCIGLLAGDDTLAGVSFFTLVGAALAATVFQANSIEQRNDMRERLRRARECSRE